MKSVIELKDGWTLHEGDSPNRWADGEAANWKPDAGLPAAMPAQVHDILLAHGKIENPMGVGGCDACKWVAERDWIYRLEFEAPAQKGRTFLRFKGLDTIVDIYLNGKPLAFHRSCFLPLRVEVTGLLRGRNTLLLRFVPAASWIQSQPAALAYQEKGGRPMRYLRKPGEDYNFFNGPKPFLTPVGVYAPLLLEVVDQAEIEYYDQRYYLTQRYSEAQLRVGVDISGEPGEYALEVVVAGPDGAEKARSRSAARIDDSGKGRVALELEVQKPELWNPVGFGAQPLYDIRIELSKNGKSLDAVSKRTGFRDLRWEGTFDFTCNGKKIKLWGANLTPLPRVGHLWEPEMARKLLEWAANAHMPTLRAWGPAQPWDENLFELADEIGVLIWAEFNHSVGPFPSDPEYIEDCSAEALHYVRSWKHHPSVLLWCGGNECYLGIDSEKMNVAKGESRLFEQVYRDICVTNDPDRVYWPNSPFGGPYGNSPSVGDSHLRTYEWYCAGWKYPIIPTENTRLTIALKKTLARHFGPDLQWPQEGFNAHRTKFNDPCIPPAWLALVPNLFWANVRLGMDEKFFDADGTPESLLFRLGAGTSRYIRENLERWRRGKPAEDALGPRRTMGHYWWKFNDSWPMIYSSLVDHLLEPNMSYYAMRRALEPVLVSIEFDDHVNIWIVNDGPADVFGKIVVRVLDRQGLKTINRLERDVTVLQGESVLATNCDSFKMFYAKNPVVAELFDREGRPISRSLEYFCPDRDNWFPEAKLELRFEDDAVVVKTDALARWIELNGGPDEFGWGFEDNFFDLLPGEEKRVRLLGDNRKGKITAQSAYSPHRAELTILD
jgi:hypothetical protein